MSDIEPTHDDLFQDGLKLVEDALAIFINLDTAHSKAISNTLHGALILGHMAYELFKK